LQNDLGKKKHGTITHLYAYDKKTEENYFAQHRARHINSFQNFGFEVKGVWIGYTPEIEIR
jgi:hypothetical protein